MTLVISSLAMQAFRNVQFSDEQDDFQNEKWRDIFPYWVNMFEAFMPSFDPGKVSLHFEFYKITAQTKTNISECCLANERPI